MHRLPDGVPACPYLVPACELHFSLALGLKLLEGLLLGVAEGDTCEWVGTLTLVLAVDGALSSILTVGLGAGGGVIASGVILILGDSGESAKGYGHDGQFKHFLHHNFVLNFLNFFLNQVKIFLPYHAIKTRP